ncbi:MAG: hypothetical protein ABS76_17500 [Pelagibacterium sp. SCN 64-44]|nr:MAG: hypothetical protein ABS76_17500 [Pelagibacterium sp. SCN 64-44]
MLQRHIARPQVQVGTQRVPEGQIGSPAFPAQFDDMHQMRTFSFMAPTTENVVAGNTSIFRIVITQGHKGIMAVPPAIQGPDSNENV